MHASRVVVKCLKEKSHQLCNGIKLKNLSVSLPRLHAFYTAVSAVPVKTGGFVAIAVTKGT